MTPLQAHVCLCENTKTGTISQQVHSLTPLQAHVCAKKNAKSGLLIRNHKNRDNKSTGSHHDATLSSGLCEEKRKIRSAHKKSQKQRQ